MTAVQTPQRITSLADLEAVRARRAGAIALRQAEAVNLAEAPEVHILVCAGTGCQSNKSLNTVAALQQAVEDHGVADRVKIVPVGCFGFCRMGPVVVVYPGREPVTDTTTWSPASPGWSM